MAAPGSIFRAGAQEALAAEALMPLEGNHVTADLSNFRPATPNLRPIVLT
jgi:hypothetical protein